MRIERGDLDDPRVVALLTTHVTRAWASHGSCHALDVNGLQAPEITFWTSWDGDALAGMGALKRLGDGHGELKSMYVDDAFRGRGHARAMIAHLLAEARAEAPLAGQSRNRRVGLFCARPRALFRRWLPAVRSVRGV